METSAESKYRWHFMYIHVNSSHKDTRNLWKLMASTEPSPYWSGKWSVVWSVPDVFSQLISFSLEEMVLSVDHGCSISSSSPRGTLSRLALECDSPSPISLLQLALSSFCLPRRSNYIWRKKEKNRLSTHSKCNSILLAEATLLYESVGNYNFEID